jgi:hypothetical protein
MKIINFLPDGPSLPWRSWMSWFARSNPDY